jgi:CRISPR/Cas system Type II protein with McrA/HNH and RuvC-like nuclease domain
MRTCKKCGSFEFASDGQCRLCKNAKERERYAKNIEENRLKARKYREENKEKDRIRKKKYAIENPEKIKAILRKSNEKNSKKRVERARKWKKANPEKVKATRENRRAAMKNSRGKISGDLLEKLYLLQKGKCACCGTPLNGKYHIDHIMPLKLGGDNSPSNIQLLNPLCNMRKGKIHPVDYMQSKGFLI